MSPPAQRGFSLLSLLAALAVGAVLVALLFPVLSRARGGAASVACLNNLRELGVALHLYLIDHNGRYPPNRANPAYQTEENPAGVHWQASLGQYLKPVPNITVVTSEMVGPFWCPADLARKNRLAQHSYGVNAFIGGAERPDQQNIRLEPYPGRRLYLLEGTRKSLSTCNFSHQTWPFNGGDPEAPNSDVHIDFRHNGKVNGLFLDGRVSTFGVRDLWGLDPRKPIPPL